MLVVDDHPLFRQALIELATRTGSVTCCGEAETDSTALAEALRTQPQLVLLDVRLKEGDGIELIKSLMTHLPDVLILVISQMEETVYAERALRAGARGYVMKEEAADVIREAIQTVLQGELYISPRMAVRLLHQLLETKPRPHQPGIDMLSDRELLIFQMIGSGLSTLQIARRLKLSPKTVQTHRENIKHKLSLDDAASLTVEAQAWLEAAGRDSGSAPRRSR